MNLIKLLFSVVILIVSFCGMVLYDTKFYNKSHKVRNTIVFVMCWLLILMGFIGFLYFGFMCLHTFIKIITQYLQ